MGRKEWIIHGILFLECYMACTLGASVQQKAESVTPISIFSPPEGNTTFVDGTTWCVARPGVSQADLQNALDWACGLGAADCSAVQPGGPCYEPDTLLSHASYAFNSYYQKNGNSEIACNFGGTAKITTRNPSYGSCVYPTSDPAHSPASSSPPLAMSLTWKSLVILIFLCLITGH